MLNDAKGRPLGLTSNKDDDEILKEIIKILCTHELTVDRASRVLMDAQKMLPYLAKLAIKKEMVRGEETTKPDDITFALNSQKRRWRIQDE